MRLLTLLLAVLWSLPALSLPYPTKVVRIIVPFPAGQATDILGRLVADQLTKTLGQQVIVENRPGAGGSIGAEAAAKAAPDGYTLLMVTISTHGIAPGLYPKLPYDPLRDFAAIANIGLTPQILMISPKANIGSMKELIAQARTREIFYGSSGNGSASHLAVEMLKAAAGIKLTHVPYKGNNDALLALMSGDISVLSDTIPGAIGPVKAGKVKAVGIADVARSRFLPDLPTIAEQGLPGVEAVGWIGLAAPAGTPGPILDRLNAEVQRMLMEPAVQEKLESLAFVAVGGSRAEFTAFIGNEITKWRKVIQEAGVKIE